MNENESLGMPGIRKTSKVVATNPACVPLLEMYRRAEELRPKTWDQVENEYMAAMEAFDDNVASGLADQGARQNGKGDFFNDLLALILESCAGVELTSRSGVPGLIFPRHNLDATYPSEGTVQFLLEAKAVGTPKHPRNAKQKNPLGRGGSADLDKRIKEAGFKTIDLKAEYGRIEAMEGNSPISGPGGNLTTWLRSVKPVSYLFISARVTGSSDRDKVFQLAERAGQVHDVVGVFAYEPLSLRSPTKYKAVEVPDHIELQRVLYRACADLVGIRG